MPAEKPADEAVTVAAGGGALFEVSVYSSQELSATERTWKPPVWLLSV